MREKAEDGVMVGVARANRWWSICSGVVKWGMCRKWRVWGGCEAERWGRQGQELTWIPGAIGRGLTRLTRLLT